MTNHVNAPFDDQHTAKAKTGDIADLPAAPEGAGDFYVAHIDDTTPLIPPLLYVAQYVGASWVWAEAGTKGTYLAGGDLDDRPATPTALGQVYVVVTETGSPITPPDIFIANAALDGWNLANDPGGASGGTLEHCLVTGVNGSPLAVNFGNNEDVPWNTLVEQSTGTIWTTSDRTAFVVPADGIYELAACVVVRLPGSQSHNVTVRWLIDDTGTGSSYVQKGGNTAYMSNSGSATSYLRETFLRIKLGSGDLIKVNVFNQSSSNDIDVRTSDSGNETRASITRIK